MLNLQDDPDPKLMGRRLADALIRLSQILEFSVPCLLGLSNSGSGLPTGDFVIDTEAITAIHRARSPEQLRNRVCWDPPVIPVAFQIPHGHKLTNAREALRVVAAIDKELLDRFPRLLTRWQKHVRSTGVAAGPHRL